MTCTFCIITLNYWHISWSLLFHSSDPRSNQSTCLFNFPSKYMALVNCWDQFTQHYLCLNWCSVHPTDLSHSPPPSINTHLPPQSSHSHKSNPKTLLLKTFWRLPTIFRMKYKLLPSHFLHDLAPVHSYKIISYSSFSCPLHSWHTGIFCLFITHKHMVPPLPKMFFLKLFLCGAHSYLTNVSWMSTLQKAFPGYASTLLPPSNLAALYLHLRILFVAFTVPVSIHYYLISLFFSLFSLDWKLHGEEFIHYDTPRS